MRWNSRRISLLREEKPVPFPSFRKNSRPGSFREMRYAPGPVRQDGNARASHNDVFMLRQDIHIRSQIYPVTAIVGEGGFYGNTNAADGPA